MNLQKISNYGMYNRFLGCYNNNKLQHSTVTTNQIGQESVTDTLYFGNGTVTYNGTM
jgi:hypothetical protein